MSFIQAARDNVSALARKALGKRVTIHQQYKTVFNSPQGEAVLAHICHHAYVGKSTFVSGDVNQTMMNEGARRLALSILNFVRKDHEQLVKQVQEQLKQYENENTM